ncbi:hypothetical protein N7G274_001505 [Stereocaulon virgatum]|uniref:Uncharacterized protein n=1 Tax=Stereocaulon virgatum TaxID=373712 RepID=A0ABR4ARF4_9LECA
MPFNHPTSPLSPVPSISSPPIFSSPSPPPQPPPSVDGTRRRSPLSDAEKLDKVFECLRTDVYWSVSDFLRVLTAAEGPVNIRRKTAFAAAAYQDSNVLGLYFDDEDRPWNGVRQSVIQALDLGNNELRNEVRRLGDMAPFSKNPSDRGGSYEKLDMSRVVDTSQKQAPILLQILRRIMAPELRRLYQRQTEPFARLVAILSILCFSQRHNTSTGFQTLLGLYFHSKGVKRRQLELLGQFGLSVSYHTILNIIKKQSEHAAAQVTASGQSDASVTAYDNFEQMEGVKEQRVDHQGAFHSVTTGQVLQGLEIPSGGLRQDMLDPQATLSATAIFKSPGNQSDAIERRVSQSQSLQGRY